MPNATGQVQEYTIPVTEEKIQWPVDSAANLGSALTFFGGEMIGINAAGFAVHMDDSAPLTFLGVLEDGVPRSVDSGDPAGALLLNVLRRRFSMATNWTAAQTDVGRPVYAAFNNKVDVVPGVNGNAVGTVVRFVSTSRVEIEPLPFSLQRTDYGNLRLITANGALNPHLPGVFVITKAGVAALTLAAPTATVDDGIQITLTSNTAFAHTLTATGLLNTGSAAVNVATFAAFAGAGLTLMAYQGKWNVLASVGIAFT
jgi:hypothetical protein